jgi:hypothetical protein
LQKLTGCRTAAESPLMPCAAGVVADLQRMAGANADACTVEYSPKIFFGSSECFPKFVPDDEFST